MKTLADKQLTIGVIGLGVGEQHARTYHRLPGCRLKWFFDLKPEKARQIRDDLGVGDVAEDCDSLLRDPDVDIVSIASFDNYHFKEMKTALDNGKNVFIEKPMCRTLDEARALKAAWKRADRPVVDSNLVLRSAPVYRWLKERVEAGDLGRIYSFDGDYLYGRMHKITEGWRKDVQDYSVMSGGGIHLIDLMVWLTGQKPFDVSSVGNNICTRDTPFHHDDFMASTFRFESGLTGRITANFGCVHKHHHVVRVFGTEGTFIYDDQGPRLYKTRDPDERPQIINHATLPAGKGDLIPGFVDAVRGDTAACASLQHNLDIVSITAAANTALTENQETRITYA